MRTSADQLNCAALVARLPEILDEPGELPGEVATHVGSCLSCHAELARGRRMLGLLGEIRVEDIPLPHGALSEILISVGKAGRRRAIRSALSGRRAGYVAGMVIGVVATGAIVVVTRAHGTRAARAGQRGTSAPTA